MEIQQAESRLKSFERIARLSSAILSMDSATMMEVRHYKRPPHVVHQVMRAALILLGDDGEEVKVNLHLRVLVNLRDVTAMHLNMTSI